jgi:hypothetical protein
MRFRRGGQHFADLKAAGGTFDEHYGDVSTFTSPEERARWRANWEATPKAEPGDVWRIFYHHEVDGQQIDDQIAGYDICCIACGRVHAWTSARNCNQKIPMPWGESCVHREARTSCWTWTGSAEEGTLTASPSLQVLKEYCPWGCGWHGFIQNGDIHA